LISVTVDSSPAPTFEWFSFVFVNSLKYIVKTDLKLLTTGSKMELNSKQINVS
jgi:hypothetical protein